MNLIPTKIGAERKKLIFLGVLVVAIPIVYFATRPGDPSAAASGPGISNNAVPAPASAPVFGAPSARSGRTAMPGVQNPPESQAGGRGQNRGVHSMEDFRPSLKPKEGVDITNIDPTLKFGLLAKLRALPMEGGSRSVFKEGAAPPPPPPPKVTITPGPITSITSQPVEAVKPSGPPPAPPPAPIPLKFYGYANEMRAGHRQAFFLDGEDIRIAGENDVIRNRYKIVRIGVNSAVVEDTTDKHQQTLQLEPEQT